MDPRGGLKTNVKLSISPACHPERSRETVVIRGLGLALPTHMPRTSPLSSAVFHTACALSAPYGAPSHRETLIQSQSQLLQEFLCIASS